MTQEVGGRKSPGGYAVGTVTGEPYVDTVDDPNWPEEDQGSRQVWCPVHFDTV
jgi:hypothetical protein